MLAVFCSGIKINFKICTKINLFKILKIQSGVDSTLGVTPDSISILYEIQNRAKIGGSEKKLRIIF